MSRTPKPLEKCCNGCDAPVQAPSMVLCKACLAELDAKFDAIGNLLAAIDGKAPPT